VQQVAQHFGIKGYVVYYWIKCRLMRARRLNPRMPYWITLTGSDEQKLQNPVRRSSSLEKGKVSPNATAEGAL
jgi:ribosomal protein L39E